MSDSDVDSPALKETARLEAFSDGVFGVAITLLVLDLKVPPIQGNEVIATSAALGRGLAMQWPAYLAFVTSFFTVLVMWVHHHALLRLVRATDAPLMFANGLLLMLISAVPFVTAVLAKYLMTPAAKMAAMFYCGMFVLIALAFVLVLLAGCRKKVLMPGISDKQVHLFCGSYRFGPLFYLAAGLAAAVNVWLSLAICTALWAYWAAFSFRVTKQEYYAP